MFLGFRVPNRVVFKISPRREQWTGGSVEAGRTCAPESGMVVGSAAAMLLRNAMRGGLCKVVDTVCSARSQSMMSHLHQAGLLEHAW